MCGKDVRTFEDFKDVTLLIMETIRNSNFLDPIFTIQYMFHETSMSMIWHVSFVYVDNKKEVLSDKKIQEKV